MILSNLDIISFTAAIASLGLWFLFANKNKWNAFLGLLFLASLGINLFLNYTTALGPLKYFYFSKNLILIGIFGTVFSIFRRNKIALFAAVLGAISVSFSLHQVKIPLRFFPQDLSAMMEEGELLIEIDSKFVDDIQSHIEKYNGTIIKAFTPQHSPSALDPFYIIDVPNDQAHLSHEILNQLYDQQLIEYGELNDEVSITPQESNFKLKKNKTSITNDPLTDNQWSLINLNAHQLHNLIIDNKAKIKKKVKIAVLDTGIDGQHEDLKQNLPSQYHQLKDPVGHGTHCAGIIAAITNNNKGIASLSFYDNLIELMPIKVLNSFGFGTQAQIINGMIQAVDNGADILSLSLGSISDNQKQRAYKAAVEYAIDQNCLVVVSAGNSHADAKNYSPANVPGVICVAATDENNQLASFSNFIDHVDQGIAAPGVNILSTYKDNTYKSLNGTSMAAPYVAATAGILKAFYPDLRPDELYEVIRFTAIPANDQNFCPIIQPAAALNLLLDGWAAY